MCFDDSYGLVLGCAFVVTVGCVKLQLYQSLGGNRHCDLS